MGKQGGVHMDNEVLMQILNELHEIKKDLRWFKEREELKQRATQESIEDAARQLTGADKDRARALVDHMGRIKKEKEG
jgi:hypothetical protein